MHRAFLSWSPAHDPILSGSCVSGLSNLSPNDLWTAICNSKPSERYLHIYRFESWIWSIQLQLRFFWNAEGSSASISFNMH
ncbi:hypothetical protein Hypma_008406 [Hypsizygus marmoreus]|uniref:Uncharacterized protein n=1 Tax=Hypsizygus marmoreus TaxID=39966 RepID=A0A369JSM9_HYPMA|nr:hypothetical protein Hypma_008406 [Hypsizygus marmoreus]